MAYINSGKTETERERGISHIFEAVLFYLVKMLSTIPLSVTEGIIRGKEGKNQRLE